MRVIVTPEASDLPGRAFFQDAPPQITTLPPVSTTLNMCDSVLWSLRETSRFASDFMHAWAVIFVIYYLHSRKNSQDVSTKTQALYAMVFMTRYIDFLSGEFFTLYNSLGKMFFLATSVYIMFLVRKYEQPDSRQHDSYSLIPIIVPSVIFSLLFNYSAPLWFWVLNPSYPWIQYAHSIGSRFSEGVLWTFSKHLESFLILPQVELLRQQYAAGVVNPSFTIGYVGLLTSYKMWTISQAVCDFKLRGTWDPIGVCTAMLQLVLYLYVLWTAYRMKVKNAANAAPISPSGGDENAVFDEKPPIIVEVEDEV